MIPQRIGRERTFQDALTFASWAHKGQKRKFSGEDYVVHAVRVGALAAALDPDIPFEILAGYVLHDAVEDAKDPTKMKVKLALEFPPETVRVVMDLTKDPTESKEEYLHRALLRPAEPYSVIGKLCDRLDNLSQGWDSIDNVKWKNAYLLSSESILALSQMNPTLMSGGYNFYKHPAWWALKVRVDELRDPAAEEHEDG